MRRPKYATAIALGCAVLALSESGWAQQPFIYPARGQSPQQQQFDQGECYSWAVQQSGFDPANPQVYAGPPPTPGAPQGGMFRGAAGGAAMGAVGGAIGGDAGKGAAIGAAAGAVGGRMRSRAANDQAKQQASAQTAQYTQEQMNNFKKAFSACMEGKKYTVK